MSHYEMYFCEKCGYYGSTSEHPGCEYLAIDVNWQAKKIAELRAENEKLKVDLNNKDDTVTQLSQAMRDMAERIKELEVYAARYIKYRDAVIALQGGPTADEFDRDIDSIGGDVALKGEQKCSD